MGSFVRKVRTASGATEIQIMHKRGRRVRGINHVGAARTDAELASLQAIALQRLHAGQNELPFEQDGTGQRSALGGGLDARMIGTSSLVLCWW